jgi:hypothetical protein
MEKNETGNTDLEQELEALYRKVASTDPPGDSSRPLPQLETGTAVPEDPEQPEGTNDYLLPEKEANPHRLLFMAMGVFFFLGLLSLIAIFFWPTIYYYESINLKEKVYPLRINKLTGDTSYFNGTAWLSPPALEAIKKPVPEILNVPSAIVPSETIKIKAQTTESATGPASINTRDKGKYVIQIKAFPENKRKDALAFMEEAKKRVPEVQMKTVHIAGHGVWYRIWVGNYASATDASHNMKNLKLSDSYPGCFVRPQSGE